jgi:uncharacterized RDD family membrane protein YckC
MARGEVVGRAGSAAPRASPAPDEGWWRELITPEGVDLRLKLATGGERAGAFLLDAVILFGGLFVLLITAVFLGIGGLAAAGLVGVQMMLILVILLFFISRLGYFIAFELTPRAATPGKRALGLRVAARNGGRLTADAVIARNLMRELEVFVPLQLLLANAQGVDGWLILLGLGWCGIFAVFPLFNRDRLRVGDLVAGTWVVRAPRRRLDADLAGEGRARLADYAFTRAQLDAYGVHELQVLEGVLRRKDRKTLAAVADRIRRKIDWTPGPHEHDDDFLAAYYVALRGRLESRLLMGKRRKDKHDKD